jgi:hypothetical protein
LGSNQITAIAPGVFSGLESLFSLYAACLCLDYMLNNTILVRNLSDNALTTLASDSFIGIPNLKILSEFFNISTIHPLNIVASRRTVLFNYVSSIESGAFNGLGNLNVLYAVEFGYAQS